MKKNYLVLAASAAFAGLLSAHAAPQLQLSDNSELFITGTASTTYDDNIFLSSGHETSDEIWDLIPGLDLPFGSSSDLAGDIFAKVDLRDYSDHQDLNVALPDVGFSSNYDEGKSKFDVTGSYQEIAQNNATIRLNGVIVQTDVASFSAYGEDGVTEKTSIGAGVNYTDTTYNQSVFVDSSDFSVPVDAYYSISPKTDLSIGYRYDNSEQNRGAPDYYDNFFNVGARGEFTPLLTGQIRIGYEDIDYTSGKLGSGDQLGVDGNLTYQATEKSAYTLNFSNGYENSGIGEVTKALTVGLSGKTEFDPQWDFVPAITYQELQYPGAPSRTDNVITGSVGIVYLINKYFSTSLTYALADDSSNLSGISFTDDRVSLAVSVRY